MATIEEGTVERQIKVLIGYFLSMSQQAVSADIIPNSAVGSPKTEGTKTKAARVLISWIPRKFKRNSRSLQTYCLNFTTIHCTVSLFACYVTIRHYSPPPPPPCLKTTEAEPKDIHGCETPFLDADSSGERRWFSQFFRGTKFELTGACNIWKVHSTFKIYILWAMGGFYSRLDNSYLIHTYFLHHS